MTSFPVVSRGGGGRFRFAHKIRIGRVIGLSTGQEGMDACIAPLLLSCSWTVTRAPGSEAPIVGCAQSSERDTGGLCFLFERLCIGETALEFSRVAGGLGFHSLVCGKSLVGRGVSPPFCTKSANLFSASRLVPFREATIVLGRPELLHSILVLQNRMAKTRRTTRRRRQRGGGCGCGMIGGPMGLLSGGGDPPGAMGPQRGTSFVSAGGYRAISMARRGGYRATPKNRAALRAFRQGKSIGFTMRASLKAKGLLPRSSRKNRGKFIVSPKYR